MGTRGVHRHLFAALLVVAGLTASDAQARVPNTDHRDIVAASFPYNERDLTVVGERFSSGATRVCVTVYAVRRNHFDTTPHWVTSCADGGLDLDATVSRARIAATVPMSSVTPETVDIDIELTATTLTYSAYPAVQHSPPGLPQGTTQFFCFDGGDYWATVFAPRDGIVTGTVSADGSQLGEARHWRTLFLRQADVRGRATNC